MTDAPEAQIVEAYREFRYRKLMGGLSHEQYEAEPAPMADWFEEFEGM